MTMSEVTINIKSSGDKKYTITIDPSSTILQLKEKIVTVADVPVERQRLIFSGKVLKDGDTLSSYKIGDGHTLHLVKGAAPKSESTPAATSNTSTPAESSNESTSAPSIPQNIAAGQGAYNPFAALTGARYAGANIPMPSADMFGPDGGMGALPDPERMDEMLSNPMFSEAMSNLMSNPQMLDFMIEQNPQLRAMGPQARQLLQSDMFRNMMSNPEYIRSAMQMQRAFGGGLSGANAASAFPAPGNPTDSTEGDASNTTAPSNTQGTTPAANPFASLLGSGNPFAALGAPGAAGTTGAAPNFADLFGMSSGFGAPGTSGSTAAATDSRPPEEVYESQLRQLNDMGFFDFDRNVRALRRSGGSVQGAIEALLSDL